MTYLYQFAKPDSMTAKPRWRTVHADTPQDAALQALRPIVRRLPKPYSLVVRVGELRKGNVHPNTFKPIMIHAFTIILERGNNEIRTS